MSTINVSLIRKYLVKGDEEKHEAIYVEWRGQRYGKGPVRWAVTDGFTRHTSCLNHLGQWEWEPQPSSRTEAFLKRTRWLSFEGALAAAEKAEPCR
jgi:hypothetical protein